jgi:ribonuclease Z
LDGRLIEHRLGGIQVLGYSVAGEETVIAAPELNVCFDVGKAPSEILAVDHVLLSHGHMDHSAGIAYYFSQRNFVGNEPGCVLVPKVLEAPLRDLMRVWGQIEGHVSPSKIVAMAPGDEYPVRRDLKVLAFAPNHGVPSLGFCVIEHRRKLKPEFADRTGPELVELKKKGVEIQYSVEIPLIAYCGDTAEGDWVQIGAVQRAQVLVLECTFFDTDHVRRARAGYHMHVKDVARVLQKLDNTHILLAHVTRRTSIRDAKQMLTKLVTPDVMSRVTFLMDGRRRRSRGPARGPEQPGERREEGGSRRPTNGG